MIRDFQQPTLSDEEFKRIAALVHEFCGINLTLARQKELLKSRLSKRLRALGLRSFEDYLTYVQKDTSYQEFGIMIDVLTTNKTSFFREPQHFVYLSRHVLPSLWAATHKVRIWSAGCSSGEEPYTLAMVLRETLADVDGADVRVLATDISPTVLEKARAGVYEESVVESVPSGLLQKYFTVAQPTRPRALRVNDSLRRLIRWAQLNLMEPWPMQGPFDVILCRNVMFYFDQPTRHGLVQRFWQALKPGGYLLIGHAESLTGLSHEFRYVQPATYQK